MGKIISIFHSKNWQNFMFVVMLASIFTYGLMYRVINPRIIFWFAVIFCVYELSKKQINPFNIGFFLLFEIYLLTGIIDYAREPWLNLYWSNLKFVWIFPTVYALGVVLSRSGNKSDSQRRVMLAFAALALGMCLQGFLDYGNKLVVPDWEYKWDAFWGTDYEVRNTYDMSFLPMISVFFYSLINKKKNKKMFIASSIILLWIMGMTMLWSHGRLVTLMVVLILAIYIFVRLLRKEILLPKKAIIVLLLIVAAAVGTGFLLFKIDFLGVQEFYYNSFLFRDGGILHNVRFQIYVDAARKTFLYPQGGWDGIYEGGGTHNTYFEYAHKYDTVVFGLLVLFFIMELINGLMLLKRKEDFGFNFALVSALLIFLIYFFLEPNGFAYRYFLAFPIFISGLIRGWSLAVDDRIRKGELKKYADISTNES